MARARRSDPATSHQAAVQVEIKGTAATHREACLAAVIKRPGMTAAEIAAYLNIERHIPSRRLPELRERNLVYNAKRIRCGITGNSSMTWESVRLEPQKLEPQSLF